MPPVSTTSSWASLGPKVLCSRKRIAARGFTAVTVTAKGLDGVLLVSGFTTVKLAEPAVAGAVPVAVKCEESTKVAARGVEPRSTCAPLKNWLPKMVMVNGALGLSVVGETKLTCATGLFGGGGGGALLPQALRSNELNANDRSKRGLLMTFFFLHCCISITA